MTALAIQVCPKCNGQGRVSRPPWLPGDVTSWSSHVTLSYRCNLCDGRMVVPVTEPPTLTTEATSPPSIEDVIEIVIEESP